MGFWDTAKGENGNSLVFALLGWTASMAIVVASILGDNWVSSSEWGGVA